MMDGVGTLRQALEARGCHWTAQLCATWQYAQTDRCDCGVPGRHCCELTLYTACNKYGLHPSTAGALCAEVRKLGLLKDAQERSVQPPQLKKNRPQKVSPAERRAPLQERPSWSGGGERPPSQKLVKTKAVQTN